LVPVIYFLISITYKTRNFGYISRPQTDHLPYSLSTLYGAEHKTVAFDPSHLRHLHPQIWVCPSAKFTGKSGYFSQYGEDRALHRLVFNNTLTNKNPGIFVEIGALDGVRYSNTLYFERMFDWRGVLIEAQPENAKKLLLVDRMKTVKLPFGICSPPQTYIRMLVRLHTVENLTDFLF